MWKLAKWGCIDSNIFPSYRVVPLLKIKEGGSLADSLDLGQRGHTVGFLNSSQENFVTGSHDPGLASSTAGGRLAINFTSKVQVLRHQRQ